jgi:hypothetical protein
MTVLPEPPRPKPCRYNCGKVIVFDAALPSPPYYEVVTGVHHTYKRCAELLGKERAATEFSKDAKERKQKQ